MATQQEIDARLKALNTIQTPAPKFNVNQADVRPTGTAFNSMQDLQRSSIQATGKPVDIPKSFDAGTLGSAPKPIVPEAPTQQISNPDATVGTATDYVTRFNKAQEQAAAAVPNTATLENTNLYNRLKDLYSKSTNKGTDLLAEQQKANVGGITKQIEEQNLLVQQKANQYQKNIAALPGQGRGITTGIISGQTDRERRLAAADIGAETAILQAMQGNLTLAKQTAQDAIDLKYKPIEQEIAQKLQLLELNAPQMTAEEKKRADITAGILQEQQQQIADKKQTENDISNVLAEAAKNQAPQDILQKIKTSTNLNDAILSAGSFISPKEKAQTSIIQSGGRNILVDTQTGRTIKDLGAADTKPQDTGRVDENGNPIYGVFNPETNTFEVTDVQNGIVGGYNIGSYATDPNHERAVASILNNIGQFKTVQDIDNYIQIQAPGSPITGQMIANAAGKYGVSWEMITAMMQQDSSLGTKGKGAKTFNPGNVGNDDAGNIRNYGSWQAGVDAVGKWLSNHKVTQNPSTAGTDNQALSDLIIGSKAFTKQQANDIRKAINNGEDPLTVAKNNARAIMESTVAKDTQNLEKAKAQMQDIQSMLQEFYAQGGDTGLLKGNYEEVLNKLGQVDNPALVQIATNIKVALQAYRNAVTGTAFSVQEGADMASVFPGIDKSEGLNTAIINARLHSMDKQIDSAYKNVLGSGYDKLKQATPDTTAPTVAPATQLETDYLNVVLGQQNQTQSSTPTPPVSKGPALGTDYSKEQSKIGNWLKNLFK